MSDSLNPKIIQDYFLAQKEVRCVFLFGSFAKGKERSSSDVDLAILLDPSISEDAFLGLRLQWMAELSNRLGREADVIILNEAGPVLKHQVLEFGRILYETDHEATTTFKARAMIDYVDWLPYKERLDKATLKHFKQVQNG